MRLALVSLLATVLLAGVPSADAAASAKSSIRFAWSQQITYAGKGDTRACRFMTEDHKRQYMFGAMSYDDCPAAIKGRYAEERKRVGRTALARRTQAEAAAARRARIRVSGARATSRLRYTMGDCTRTRSQKFRRVNGRWLVDVSTANSESLGCLG